MQFTKEDNDCDMERAYNESASRLKLDVLRLSEVRRKNAGRWTTDKHVMIYSGHKTEHRHGVGVLINKQVSKSMRGFHALSDRILIVKIASKPLNLVIVQVYAPTSTSPEDEIGKFYDDLDAAYKPRHEDRYGRS